MLAGSEARRLQTAAVSVPVPVVCILVVCQYMLHCNCPCASGDSILTRQASEFGMDRVMGVVACAPIITTAQMTPRASFHNVFSRCQSRKHIAPGDAKPFHR